MASTTLDSFVREALNRGEPREKIATALVTAGWTQKQAEAALAAYVSAGLALPIPRPQTYVAAREAFLYIVLFILLTIVAWNLGALIFALIDMAIPDPLDAGEFRLFSLDFQIKSALASLLVGTPLFSWLAISIRRQRRTNVAMQRSRIRKWITYAMLTIATFTLVGDVIGLVYNFLTGELSARLILKLLVVAIISGGILFYYIRDAELGDEHDSQA